MPIRDGQKEGTGGGGGGSGDITAVNVAGPLLSGGGASGDVTVTSITSGSPTWTGTQHKFNPGTSQGTPILLDMAQPGSNGQRDSHALQYRGTAYDGTGHNADWREYVDISSNAGASTFVLQNRIDVASFTTLFSVADSGLVTVAGKVTGLTQATAATDAVAGGRTVTAGAGLTGGGALTGDITINFATGDTTLTVAADTVVVNTAVIATRTYADTAASTAASGKANSSVQIIAGGGLTGTGDLTANVTLVVGTGTGITVNADDIAVNQAFAPTWTGAHTFTKTLALAPTNASTTAGAATILSGVLTSHSVSSNAEVTLLDWNMAATLTLGLSGTLATNRLAYWRAPTLANGSAQTITSLYSHQFDTPVVDPTNLSVTNVRVVRVGSDAVLGASAAASTYAGLSVGSHTLTYSSVVAQTDEASITGLRINPLTIAQNTGSGTLTVASSATFYVSGEPIAGTGSAITDPLAALIVGRTRIQYEDATTNTAINTLILRRTTSGTAAGSFGQQIQWEGETSGGVAGVMAVDRVAFASGGATTVQRLFFMSRDNGATVPSIAQVDFSSAGAYNFKSSQGNAFIAIAANIAGSPGLKLGSGSTTSAHTAGAEVIFFDINGGIQQHASNTAVTTQRNVVFTPSTLSFASATGNITNAINVEIGGPPILGTNAAFVGITRALRVGGSSTFGAAAAAAQVVNVDLIDHTVTFTGTTSITSVPSVANLVIGQVTVTDASGLTVASAASLYIKGAPIQAGSVTLTKTYAIWSDDGLWRYDGQTVTAAGGGAAATLGTIGGSGPTTAAQAKWVKQEYDGVVHWFPAWT